MIRSFVSFAWVVYTATSEDPIPRLLQGGLRPRGRGSAHCGLRWWPRCCNSDREASLLVAPDFAATKKRQCYAYLGVGN